MRLKRSGVKPASVFAKNDGATGLLVLSGANKRPTITGVLKRTKRI